MAMGNDGGSQVTGFWIGMGITALVAALVIGVVIAARTGVLQTSGRITTLTNNVDESMFTQYDGEILKGSAVIGAIDTLRGQIICVEVNNGSTTTQYILKDNLTDDADGKLSDAKNRSHNSYITPTSDYLGEVIRDSNTEKILKITFTKQ